MSGPPRIAVVDYGSGNLRSVARALARSGLEPEVTADPAALRATDGVVLPGVGAFAAAVASLREKGLDDAIRECLEAERPYLGICLGLQVLFEWGDEHGLHAGLGLLPGRVERFPERAASGAPLRVPHIGWNRVRFEGSHPMLDALPGEDVFYFVHAYRAVPAAGSRAAGYTDYGGEFASVVATRRLFAVQFHPEKSQAAGRRVLDAFAGWVSAWR